jgi:hypothetical protein
LVSLRKFANYEVHSLEREIEEDGEEWEDKTRSLPEGPNDKDGNPKNKKDDECQIPLSTDPGAEHKKGKENGIEIEPVCSFPKKQAE